jgi:hypothetical protein
MDPHSRQVSLGFTPDRCAEGLHICYLYNDEQDWKRIIPPYVRSGIEEHEMIHYLADADAPDLLEETLERLGIAAPIEELEPQLRLATAMQTYCPGGRFVPEAMLERLRDMSVGSRAAGTAGARMSGEMSWALRGIPGSERLLEYEAKINDMLQSHPLTVLCQYDTKKFDGATVFEIINVHPVMIVRGQIMRNPFYAPPANGYPGGL